MVVKKYFGKTTRDALRQVREELGADALILSNRPTQGGGVEIMAVADADVANLATTLSTSSSRHPPRNAPSPTHGTAVNRALARTYAMPVEPLSAPPAPRTESRAAEPEAPAVRPASAQQYAQPAPPFEPPVAPQTRQAAPTAPPRTTTVAQATAESAVMASELKEIGDEIKLLRSLLQSQLASFAWTDMEGRTPNRIELFKQLLATGLSSTLIRQLIEKLPSQYNGETALKWARSALLHNLRCVEADNEMMERGGVFALVGPTGVGKTTTVAKLAARATMKFGPQHVALITTDSYRIGAQDQLRIYGKILGVPVFSIQNEGDLQLTLADLATRHIIFIDTVGMGQRDARVGAQTSMFAAMDRQVDRILVMAANADGHTLEDVVRNYQGQGLSGCILSKIDESVSLGASLDIVIRNRLKVCYVTNGQRVPEDLHSAHGSFLVDRALKAPHTNSPFALQHDELQILNSAQAGWL
ncbi:flagellar biosynthesis protein FlhF [Paludibacterium purpuratum]|uniref:Flagellar biosynthesis protein FlhF n=1 Tax=Paludibacterium purpuratum TaxID=1144873 RepID=A0A4R7BF52_9NEIS|nr:flagellar biosynthesis protein FlhF [Paludibacterium purpuratum]TDR82665.1 flagellar biosynthesis protein FlhF [Paludibacterium purpuratum]